MKTLTFITSNPSKAEQLSLHLSFPIVHAKLDIDEIQSLDLEEIAVDKAKRTYDQLGTPVLVEDTSLTFNALGALPGPLIKWFLNTLDNDGLCKLLDNHADRSAKAEVCFVLYDDAGPHVFFGSHIGMISETPKGERGFGWDPIFIPEGETQTWGEMDPQSQEKTSMRRVALQKLQEHLDTNCG